MRKAGKPERQKEARKGRREEGKKERGREGERERRDYGMPTVPPLVIDEVAVPGSASGTPDGPLSPSVSMASAGPRGPGMACDRLPTGRFVILEGLAIGDPIPD
jgi:hypothetical protein